MIKRNDELKGYLSSKDAGSSLGYTHDYISRLCRQGKISGIQKGREWFVLPQELKAFKKRHEIELKEKKKELSKKFSKIRLEFEAKKRKAREVEEVSKTEIKKDLLNNDSKKSINFFIPGQFVALVVLALMLFIPNFINNLSINKDYFDKQASLSSFSIKSLSENINQGIKDTIYMQSTVVPKVANIFALTEYLADGYWQYFNVIGELPYKTYSSLNNIGRGYLVIYLLQGEAVYKSFQNLDNIGYLVLRGYELVGESLYFGGADILNKYAIIFSFKEMADIANNNFNDFSANVSGGYKYASENITTNVLNIITNKISHSLGFVIFNINRNFSEIGSTFSQVSRSTSAYVGTLFDFDLVDKQSKIRKIQ